MDEMDYFRAALKHYVNERGAQSNLSLDAHISEGYISQIINKKRGNPSRRTMIKIADALKTTYHDMIVLGRSLINDGIPAESSDTKGGEPSVKHLLMVIEELRENKDLLKKEIERLTAENLRLTTGAHDRRKSVRA